MYFIQRFQLCWFVSALNEDAYLNRDLNRVCLVYMFSLRFSVSKFLINLRRQFRVRKIFCKQVFGESAVFPFCVQNDYFENT